MQEDVRVYFSNDQEGGTRQQYVCGYYVKSRSFVWFFNKFVCFEYGRQLDVC